MKPEIWVMDLMRCEPAGAVSRDGPPGTWIAVDYEIDRGKGVMLFAVPHSDAPPLTLRLNAAGWHEVRLGIYYSGSVDRVLCAKLSADAAFTRFCREEIHATKDGNYPEKLLRTFDLAEVFWKCADLTGQDLVIARPPKGVLSELHETNLAYVRLVPMDGPALAEWKSEQPTEETKILIAEYDTGSTVQWGISTPEDFLAEFECLRDSDFDIVFYSVAQGPITLYPTKVGELLEAEGPFGKALNQLAKNGFDLLAEGIKAARACRVKLFPKNELFGLPLSPKYLSADRGERFLADHPEWVCTYPDGEPIRTISFAFEGVRDVHIRLMREWVEDYRADGVNTLFSRSFPLVYYEEPVCRAFQQRYGEDMRKLPVSDERVQRVRASFVTQFLRQARAMLDEVGKKQERYIPTSYRVPVYLSPDIPPEARQSALAECLFNALDVSAWVREGLVDYLVPHLHVWGEHDGTAAQPKIREFIELANGTKTKVFVEVYPRRMPPRQYRKIAMSYYAAGADGLAFWDTHSRNFRASEWAFVKRLGHRPDLARWEQKGDDYYRVVPLRRLGGFITGREFS